MSDYSVRLFAAGITLVSVIGCASVHGRGPRSTYYDRQSESWTEKSSTGLVISAREDTQLATSGAGVVWLAFENPTDQWIELDGLKLSFPDDKSGDQVSLVLGDRLGAWREGIENRERMDRHNMRAVLAALFAAGAVTGAVGAVADDEGDGNAVEAAGKLTAAAAAGGIAVTETHNLVEDSVRDAEGRELLPEKHVLSAPIKIPPGMYLRRFVVVSAGNGDSAPYVYRAKLSYVVAGKREYATVPFRGYVPRPRIVSEWQLATLNRIAPVRVDYRHAH